MIQALAPRYSEILVISVLLQSELLGYVLR